MPYLSLTTWSLHRHLGPQRWTRWDESKGGHVTVMDEQPETVPLLKLPEVLAQKGFKSLEVCHFHIPDTSETYLMQLRNAFQQAGIRFYTLLIDYGDISAANDTRRNADIEWIKRWIDIAAIAGAERVRVIGGDGAPTDAEALKRAVSALQDLVEYASVKGVRVVTENFHSLTSIADNCLYFLNSCGNGLGLTSDFGNFNGVNKYDELDKTIPQSESIHAKAKTDENGFPDKAEFEKCLDIAKTTGYDGPITLVYDGPNDMWEGIERLKVLVTPYL